MAQGGSTGRLLVLLVALAMLPSLPAEPAESPNFSGTTDTSSYPVAWFEAEFTMSNGVEFGAFLIYPAEEGGGGDAPADKEAGAE